jgi:hypothetical protein
MMPSPATKFDPPALESRASTQALRVSHFRFAPDARAGESVRRRFTQPRSMVAIEQPAEALSMVKPWPETLDDLYVVLASTPLTSEARSKIDSWLAAPDHPDARPPLAVQLDAGTVRWRPGRAAAESAVDVCKDLVVALVEFSFFEGELRRLEQELVSHEASASQDVTFAYQVGQADRTQWKRLGQTMVSISRLRLTFARLEPGLRAASPSLPPDARKAITRLIAGADVPSRLEAFDSRLEVCEDLYEGAVDRIADFRWYRNGERLEIAIVVLLVLEVILSAWGLRLR